MAVRFNYNTGTKVTYNGLPARRSRLFPDYYFFDNGRVINAKTKLMANNLEAYLTDMSNVKNFIDKRFQNLMHNYNQDKYQKGGKMTDDQLQEAFVKFLVQKSGAKNEKELQAYVKQLGEEGMQQAYAEFTEIMNQQTQKAKHGAKLNYVKRLKHQCPEGYELQYHKKGGIVECGCGKKMEDGGKAEKKQSVVDKFKARKAQKGTKAPISENDTIHIKNPITGKIEIKDLTKNNKHKQFKPLTKEDYRKLSDKDRVKVDEKDQTRSDKNGGKIKKAGTGCTIKPKFVKS